MAGGITKLYVKLNATFVKVLKHLSTYQSWTSRAVG